MDSPFSVANLDRLVAQQLAASPPAISQPLPDDSGGVYGPPEPKWNVNNAAFAAAILGPLADGASTVWALNQSGPNARVSEGNALFGKSPSGAKIMGIKAGQALLQGLIAKWAGRKGRQGQDSANALGFVSGLTGTGAASWNIYNGRKARNINKGDK